MASGENIMSEAMLSELQQKDVWEGWLSAEMRANYFADRGSFYSKLQNGLTWTILFASSGAAGTVISGIGPLWLKSLLTLVAAGLSLFSLVKQNPKRYSDCSDLHFKWNRLAYDYKTLWDNMYADSAAATLRNLEERAADLSKSSMAIPYKERVMLKWENYVLKHHGLQAA